MEMENKDEQKRSRKWSDLPLELMDSISRYMSISDLANLRVVCRSWKSVGNRRYRSSTCFDAGVFSFSSPTLITAQGHRCTFYDPIHHYVTSSKEIPELFGTDIIGSGHGWLILRRESDPDILFLFNFATLTKVELPKCSFSRRDLEFACLSAPLNSPGCFIIAMSQYHSEYWMIKPNETNWTEVEDPNHITANLLGCAPAMFQGKLYCMDYKGRLFVLDSNNGPLWQYPCKPPPPLRHWRRSSSFREFFLVACETELWAVLLSFDHKRVSIYGLDPRHNTWRHIESLGDNKMLFVSHKSSFLIDADTRGFANKIYFSKFDWSGSGIVYDFRAKSFITLLKDDDVDHPCKGPPGFIKKPKPNSAWYQINPSTCEECEMSSW